MDDAGRRTQDAGTGTADRGADAQGLGVHAAASQPAPLPQKTAVLPHCHFDKPGLVDDKSGSLESLTPRQQEILGLLRQGKVNKEIAKALNISLGTVKQHIHTLFRKLNARNRTMAAQTETEDAVAEPSSPSPAPAAPLPGLRTYRPCTVLAIAFLEEDYALEKQLHAFLAEKAFDAHALLIHRQENVHNLMFGLKRSRESDLLVALALLAEVHAFFVARARLKAAFIAGLVPVGQNPMGGWSGEVQAADSLDAAFALLMRTPAEALGLNQEAIFLMQGLDLPVESLPKHASDGPAFPLLPLSRLPAFYSWSSRVNRPLVGREQLFDNLQSALAWPPVLPGAPRTAPHGLCPVVLLGENGMGKSRLVREVLTRLATPEDPVGFLLVLSGGRLLDLVDGRLHSDPLAWAQQHHGGDLTKAGACSPLLVVDEAHEFNPTQWEVCLSALTALGQARRLQQPCRLMVTSRAGPLYEGRYPAHWPRFHIGKLDENAAHALIHALLAVHTTAALSAHDGVAQARHIPFFLCELGRHQGLSLAFLTLVASRFDRFRMDWRILYGLAESDAPLAVAELAQYLHASHAHILEQLEGILASRVVAPVGLADTLPLPAPLTPESQLMYRHPLVKQAIRALYRGNASVSITKA